jgi:hypothetical protein
MAAAPSLSASLLSMVPLLLVPAVYAAFLKFSAFLFRRAQLSWRHAFVFGLLSLFVGAAFVFVKFIGASSPSFPIGLTLGTGSQLALGGWYLGGKARTKEGEPLKFVRGALLTLIFLIVAVLVGVVASVLLQVYRNGSAS